MAQTNHPGGNIMPATVYYADMRSRSHEDSKIAKVARLCDAVGLKKIIKKNDLTAVKLLSASTATIPT